jgi:hypothetical protein
MGGAAEGREAAADDHGLVDCYSAGFVEPPLQEQAHLY